MIKEMRRKDRQMDEAFAWQVFDQSPYQVLSTTTQDGTPYGIPVSCARIGKHVYFHCAKEGQKLDNIRNQKRVCISAVGYTHIPEGKFTTEYESCVLFGNAEFVIEDSETKEALRAICQRYTPDNMNNFQQAVDRSLKNTQIIKIEVTQITGKRKKYGKNGRQLKFGAMDT